jgi:DNA-binding response OmpR family regulator
MKRILLVEDEDDLRGILRIFLEKMGYAVSEARNGKEGIGIFNKEAIDLVISDLMMPEKEGLETIRELKRSNPHVKIIAISGGGRSDARDNLKMAKLFGATVALPKPFPLHDLAKAVKDLVGVPASGAGEQVLQPE